MCHYDKNSILVDVQHGYHKGQSYDTQLSALVNDLAKILDDEGQVDYLIIIDFSKAFGFVVTIFWGNFTMWIPEKTP